MTATDPPSLQVVVELERGHRLPTGRITDERGVRSSFSGWLELMDRLEGVLRRAEGELSLQGRGDAG